MANLIKNLGEQKLRIVYKLIIDLIFLCVLSFAGLLIVEAALPGFLSKYVSLSAAAFTVFLLILGAEIVAKYLPAQAQSDIVTRKKFFVSLAILAVLLVAYSMLKFSLLQNIVICSLTLSSVYLLFKIIADNSSQN